MAAITAALLASAQLARADDAPQRARKPSWPPDVLDVFFEDARRQLDGARPKAGEMARSEARTPPEESTPAEATARWSPIIDGDALTTEVKRLANGLRQPLANASQFKAGGYQACRRDFGLLAVLFAVIADSDEQVRWRDQADGLRAAFQRASANCKVGTDGSYAEAKARQTDMADMIRGQPLQLQPPDDLQWWSDLADRALLMQRMETALEARLSPALATRGSFRRQGDDIRHEAQIVAMLAEVMRRENYEYWDDDEFAEMARQLGQSASELARAAAEGNYDAAQQAAAKATKSCSDCHEGYRG